MPQMCTALKLQQGLQIIFVEFMTGFNTEVHWSLRISPLQCTILVLEASWDYDCRHGDPDKK